MEVKELPREFGINRNFKIKAIDPKDYLKKLLNRRISAFSGFKLDKNSYLIVIIYSNDNKELIHVSKEYYRRYFKALNKKVNNSYM